jgi:hypothetical protein
VSLLAGALAILAAGFAAVFFLHMILWLTSNLIHPKSLTRVMYGTAYGVEVLLFLASVALNCVLFLASGAFPAGASWVNRDSLRHR